MRTQNKMTDCEKEIKYIVPYFVCIVNYKREILVTF
jgi:hypothetical protein